MKYILLNITLFITTLSTAQTLKYSNDFIDFEDQNIQTVTATLEPDVSTIKDKFEDWMNDNYNVDLDGKKLLFFNKDVMSADDVIIAKVSNKKLKLSARVDESAKGKTRLHVFAKPADGPYFNKIDNPIAFRGLNEIVHEFVAEYLQEYYMERIEDSEDNMKDLVENKEDMENKIEKNEKKIKDLQNENRELREKIAEASSDIKDSESNLKTKNAELQAINKKIKSQ